MIALSHIKAVNGGHKADIALADQVHQIKTMVLIFFCDVYDKAKVRFYNLLFRCFVTFGRLHSQGILFFTGQQGNCIDFS